MMLNRSFWWLTVLSLVFLYVWFLASDLNAAVGKSDHSSSMAHAAASLAGVHHIEVDATLHVDGRRVTAPTAADFRRMHPAGNRFFCPQQQESTHVLPEFRSAFSRPTGRTVLVRISDCPNAVLLHRVPPLAVQNDVFMGGRLLAVIATPLVSEETAIAICLRECLSHPCCVGYHLLPAEGGALTVRGCHLIKVRRDTLPARDELLNLDLFMLHTESIVDVGPSQLGTGELRLVVTRGPTSRVARLDAHGHWRHEGFHVAVHRHFDENVLPVDTVVTAKLVAVETSKVLHRAGVLMIKGRALVPELPRFSLSMQEHVGTWVDIHLAAFIPDAGRSLAVSHRYFVQREAGTNHRRLLFVDPSAPPAAADDASNDAPSQWKRPLSRLSRSTECASMLRDDECCLGGVVGVQYHPEYDGYEASNADSKSERVHLTSAVAAPSRCVVTLVDGWYSRFNEFGVAAFPNLVIRVHPGCAEDANSSVVLTLYDHYRAVALERKSTMWKNAPARVVGSVTIPAAFLVGCGGRKQAEARPAVTPLMRVESAREVEGIPTASGVPVLFSVSLYQNVPAAAELVDNLVTFASPCIIVIHISEMWNITTEGLRISLSKELKSGSPRIFINSERIEETKNHLHLAHLSNIRYMLAAPHGASVAWSHVAFVAANELFVRRGAVEYMRRYDMSNAIPTHQSGFTFDHNRERSFLKLDELFRARQQMVDALDQFSLSSLIRRCNVSEVPDDYITIEGSFFVRRIAEELAGRFLEWIPRNFCEDGRVFANAAETQLYTIAPRCDGAANRCGERLSTLLLGNDDLTATVEDVWRVRCSPFAVPFAFKRVAGAVRHAVHQVALDPLEVKMFRSDKHCA